MSGPGADIFSKPPDNMAGEHAPLIFLGDLMQAWNALEIEDGPARAAVARALGFTWQEPGKSIDTEIVSQFSQFGQTPSFGPATLTGSGGEGTEIGGVQPLNSGLESSWLPSILTSSTPSVIEIDPRMEQPGKPLPNADEGDQPTPPLIPLLVSNWTRGILSGALATRAFDGPPDLAVLVDSIAHRRPLDRLPRLPVSTLRRGVQLLLDRSTALQPFSRDQRELVKRARVVVGSDKLQVLNFAGLPIKAGIGPRAKWSDYAPPPTGTVILLLTDLGIGRPLFGADAATAEEWRSWAAAPRMERYPIVCLVPYAPSRWPTGLDRVMTLLPWDRSTTAGVVRRRVGRGYKVAR